MLIPDRFSQASVAELLEAAGKGHVGLDRRWLDAVLAHGENAIPEIVRFATDEARQDEPIVLDEVLLLLFRHFRSPESMPYFVAMLRSGEELSEQLIPALQSIGAPAVEPLIQLYSELEEDAAGDVTFSLAALRIPDARILSILTDRLEYDLSEGAICLGLYGDADARPELERVLAQEEDAHLRGLLTDAIEQLGRGPDKQDEEFDLQSFFEDRVAPPAEMLEEDDLREMLKSSDAEYRLAAATAFVRAEAGDDTIEEILEHAATDEDPRVRGKCWEALAELAEDEEVRDAMIQRLSDESAPKVERAGALVGLGQVAGEEPVRKFAEEFYKDPETRAVALQAMWNSLDRSFAPFFLPHIEDPDPDVRRQAISGCGYLGIHESAERLRTMFNSSDFRENALFAYALCARAEISPARIRQLLRRIEEFADGLEEDEQELVELALDERLLLNGHKPVFHPEAHGHHAHPEEAPKSELTPGRNDPCPCGSGKKFKKCHGA